VSEADRVEIHYRRLPDHEVVFDQRVVLERDDVIVTLSEPVELEAPMTVDDHVILEEGSRAVWFTFPGRWHDVGRFHRADGTFTGYYANILTPPRIEGSVWHTTDLFLDVWLSAHGDVRLLDEDELATALQKEHIDPATAQRAREEANRLLGLASIREWPPRIVEDWTLARVLSETGVAC